MAVIPKGKAIHTSGHLKNAIEYIQKDDKTNFKMYILGMNVAEDPELASLQFDTIQKLYDKGNYKDTEKENIIAHHFKQSFAKDEKITPELAMAIAIETAQKHFGDNFQISIATHIDKDHIHSHFIVNSISMTGVKYHSQGDTLSAFRKTSDDICKSYGLSTLDYSKHKRKRRTLTYNRWKEKQKGVNWKDRIKIDIDKAIIKSNNFEDLFKELDKLNYECKYFNNAKGEKYFAIRDKKFKKEYFANTKNFGEGYDLKSLEDKINNKDLIKIPNEELIVQSKTEIRFVTSRSYKHTDIQLRYKSTIKILVDLITSKNVIKPIKYYKQYPYSVKNDFHVQTLADQLNFCKKKNISNFEELKNSKGKARNAYKDLTIKVNELVKMRATHKTLVKEFETLALLQNKDNLTLEEIKILRSLESKLDDFDLKKIKDNLVLIEENIEKVKPIFKQYGEEIKMFEDIESTLKEIEEESYINKAKISNDKNIDNIEARENKNNIERS